jgi:hypothetical protein
VRPLRDVHETYASMIDLAISVSVVKNFWMDLDENYYEVCEIGDGIEIVLFKFLPSVVKTWWTKKPLWCHQH